MACKREDSKKATSTRRTRLDEPLEVSCWNRWFANTHSYNMSLQDSKVFIRKIAHRSLQGKGRAHLESDVFAIISRFVSRVELGLLLDGGACLLLAQRREVIRIIGIVTAGFFCFPYANSIRARTNSASTKAATNRTLRETALCNPLIRKFEKEK